MVDFKVTLIDGSYHNVDSDEHSFRAAGRKAFRNAMEKARPTLLEPIMDVVPRERNTRAWKSDLNGKIRGFASLPPEGLDSSMP